MKDYLGKDLEVGDEVAYISSQYKEFELGKILSIGECRVTIERWDENRKPYTKYAADKKFAKTIKTPDQIIRQISKRDKIKEILK